MSRRLPPRPNIEYLRKQAKDLLQELQQRDPVAQLAEAQHALAREYGFASWPKLKTYVNQAPGVTRESPRPFTGRWQANLAKSKRHPANPFQAAMVEFDVSDNTIRIADVVVDETGREERHVNTIHADGRKRPAESGNGYSLTAGWRGSHVLETLAKKGGQPAGAGRYEVSADGKALTVSGDESVIVFDRAETSDQAL